ncbi:hypothetical protein A464_1348 [Salmonella bongori N268-08]|uniref:Uncharacterized protein n=1 Tax=Salmonella bongori N268-08 TaxID=1197719 RepID=S5MVB1_SALBN|nr:hypothetical protein A464_1348 [Salmonella bongori N268-08]
MSGFAVSQSNPGSDCRNRGRMTRLASGVNRMSLTEFP